MMLRLIPLWVSGGVRSRIVRLFTEIDFSCAERLVISKDLGTNSYIVRFTHTRCSSLQLALRSFLVNVVGQYLPGMYLGF